MSFRGRTCAGSVISKISRQHYLPPIIATTRRRTTRATNNQHFPISVNLARSFNGKRRSPVRRSEEWNGYVDSEVNQSEEKKCYDQRFLTKKLIIVKLLKVIIACIQRNCENMYNIEEEKILFIPKVSIYIPYIFILVPQVFLLSI